MLHLIQSSLFKKNVSNQTKNKTLTAIIREMLMLDLVIGQPHSTYDVNIPITYFYFYFYCSGTFCMADVHFHQTDISTQHLCIYSSKILGVFRSFV